jgi:ATP-dependent Clp protease ATP-binding subunit ClpX
LRRILTEPKNALIKQYVKLFEMDKMKLSFDKKVLDFIVERAVEYRLVREACAPSARPS